MALEIGWGSLPAQIAVDALVVYVEFPGRVFRISICNVGHRLFFSSHTRAQVIPVGSASYSDRFERRFVGDSVRFHSPCGQLSKAITLKKRRRCHDAWQANCQSIISRKKTADATGLG